MLLAKLGDTCTAAGTGRPRADRVAGKQTTQNFHEQSVIQSLRIRQTQGQPPQGERWSRRTVLAADGVLAATDNSQQLTGGRVCAM